jgi:hypothetical protein
MNNNETCIHDGVSPVSLLATLHSSQGGSGRHKCPTCAYEQGFILGSSGKWNSYDSFCKSLLDPESCIQGSVAPTNILEGLGENQGGTGRHKCTNCAFKQGFEVSLFKANLNNISLILVPTPIGVNLKNKQRTITPITIDFIEMENSNKQLGNLGEKFILENEIAHLNEHGKSELAKRVKHVSVDIGDGLGYDILSFDVDGNEKRIEVKTTRGDITRPFYITQNELAVSVNNSNNYFLYRLFDFDSMLNKGKYYVIKGNLTNSLTLDSILYVAFPKPN